MHVQSNCFACIVICMGLKHNVKIVKYSSYTYDNENGGDQILYYIIYNIIWGFLSFGTLKNKLPPLDGHKRDYKI